MNTTTTVVSSQQNYSSYMKSQLLSMAKQIVETGTNEQKIVLVALVDKVYEILTNAIRGQQEKKSNK